MDLKRAFPDLIFLEDDWWPLLQKGNFANVAIVTNREGRPNTPSQRALCRLYPALLSDMMLCAKSIHADAVRITDEPVITIIQDAAFYHVPAYDSEKDVGRKIQLDVFITMLMDIIENYIKESPDDSLYLLLPPDRGDPKLYELLVFLHDMVAMRNVEIIILQES